jgi:hypothetical protein
MAQDQLVPETLQFNTELNRGIIHSRIPDNGARRKSSRTNITDSNSESSTDNAITSRVANAITFTRLITSAVTNPGTNRDFQGYCN